MAYTIRYITGGTVETERWVGKLSVAQAVAKRTVAEGRANRVEIRTEAGALLFQYPQAMHSA